MESIVVLCNHLQRTLANHSGARPSRASLKAVFSAYQKERESRMKEILDFSSLITRLQAWDSFTLRFFATWIVPYQPDRRIADQLGDIIKRAPKLEYVDVGNDFKTGTVPWEDTKESLLPQQKIEKRNKPARMIEMAKSHLLQLLTATAALTSFAWLVTFYSGGLKR
jgi:hypothetical protein